MYLQQTIRNHVTFSGIGLHSGVPVTMNLRPAAAGTGVVFHRTDLAPSISIEATAANVVNTRLSTTIGVRGAVVATIEHLMAALGNIAHPAMPPLLAALLIYLPMIGVEWAFSRSPELVAGLQAAGVTVSANIPIIPIISCIAPCEW